MLLHPHLPVREGPLAWELFVLFPCTAGKSVLLASVAALAAAAALLLFCLACGRRNEMRVVGLGSAISVARAVMDKSPHNVLVGEGALDFARQCGIEIHDSLSPGTPSPLKICSLTVMLGCPRSCMCLSAGRL